MLEINLKLLDTIIDENKNTEYGKKYNFSEIKTIDDYKKNVPLTVYDDYESYIKRMYDGENNILTVYPIMGYLWTSGSEKFQKKMPLTIKSMENLGIKPFVLRNKIMNKYKNDHHNCYILHIDNHFIDVNKEPPKNFILSEIAYYYVYKNKIEDFNKYFFCFF